MHGDHFWLDNVRALNSPLVAPSDVVAQLAAENVRAFTIKAGDTFGFADASITAFTVDHGAISVPILNLGYLISVGNRTVFFAGDMKVGSVPSVAFDTILIPVGGNKVFSALEAVAYLEGAGFRGQAVPIHTEMAAEEGAAARFERAAGTGLRVLNLAVGAASEL